MYAALGPVIVSCNHPAGACKPVCLCCMQVKALNSEHLALSLLSYSG